MVFLCCILAIIYLAILMFCSDMDALEKSSILLLLSTFIFILDPSWINKIIYGFLIWSNYDDISFYTGVAKSNIIEIYKIAYRSVMKIDEE